MKFLRYLLLLPLFLGLNSCMEYDMSYPRILAEFVEFNVQGAKKVTIDPSNMVVNIDLAEEESLSAVKVNSVKLNDKSYFKDGEFPEVLDLREPYSVILSLYQDYRWTIKASQSVDRVFKCANQVGAPTFDTDHNEIIAYVSNTQRLKNLRIDEMKLELIGSKVVRTTGRVLVDNQVQEITQDCEFPMELDCTLKRGARITKSHMDLDQCIEVAQRLKAQGNADGNTVFVLSHIGHLVERTHGELCREAEPYGFTVAYDGMEIEI